VAIPLNAISNFGFETGDYSDWNEDGSGQISIISPGHNSEYAASLFGLENQDSQPGFDMAVALVPGLTYTYSFDYFLSVDQSSSSLVFSGQIINIDQSGEPVAFSVGYNSPGTADRNGNQVGAWYTMTFPPFVAVSTNYDVSVYLESDGAETGIYLDNFQLLASIPSPPSAPTAAPVNEMGSNAGFEIGDYSGWYISQDQEDGPPTQMTITSPGYESDYAAYLFGGDQGGADYLDMSFGLVSGTSYTFSFAYNMNVVKSASVLTLSGYIRANDVESQPVSFSIGYDARGSTDDHNNQVGAWNIISFPSFVAAADSYSLSLMLEADGDETGVYLDDFQLVASAPTSSSVAPTAVYTTTTVT